MTQLRISSYFADSSIMHASYAVSIRRPAILPPASFRPCLTTTPLLLANDLELSFRAVLVVDFHHQVNAHAGQTKKLPFSGSLQLRSTGLEPAQLSPLAPQASVSTKPAQLSPLAPQASVSTNSTTTARQSKNLGYFRTFVNRISSKIFFFVHC